MMMAERYYHPDYRKDEVSAIVEALDQGSCLSVIGPPSVGKSNLLKFMGQEPGASADPANPWVRYAPNAGHEGRIVSVSIDPNALLPALPDEKGNVAARAWPGFELLTYRTTVTPPLYPTFAAADRTSDPDLVRQVARLQERFENAHPDLTDFEDHLHAHLALRHLENIIDAALTSHRIQGDPVRIVYFLDEFERLLDTMPDYFFVALRSIRDRFKYEVMFVTFTRNSLPYLIPDGRMALIEPFVELFVDTPVYLKPFGDDDAWRMIEQLEDRSISKDDHPLGLLIRATGGFAGLLRAGFKHAEKLGAIQDSDYHRAVGLAAARLVAEENVQAECRTLIRGLNDDEIKTLYGVAAERTDLNPATIRELINKSLLSRSSPEGAIRVSLPVLAAYIRNHPTPPDSRPPARPVTMPE
jgi:hypothetical protein